MYLGALLGGVIAWLVAFELAQVTLLVSTEQLVWVAAATFVVVGLPVFAILAWRVRRSRLDRASD
jgi:hypothetical protein